MGTASPTPSEPPAPSAPEVKKDTFVSFSAEINVNTTESLLATMANIANQNVSRVHLLMSTAGGNVTNGINLYNVLRRCHLS